MAELSMNCTIRPLLAADVDAADVIMRIAFGTFIGVPDPATFGGDTNFVRTRWKANPAAAFAAEFDGKVVGSNFGAAWGSVGFFGPLTTHPTVWDKGIGKRLVPPVLDYLRNAGVRHLGLFTFANSPKHIALYQKFGFMPRYLTMVLTKPVTKQNSDIPVTRLSQSRDAQALIRDCRALTDEIYSGLDLSSEISSVSRQKLGETIALTGGDRVDGFAVCHIGPGTEAGTGACYLKFAAARTGAGDAKRFADLLAACESLAVETGVAQVVIGVNTACAEAYCHLLSSGYRVEFNGVAMHAADDAAYYRPGVYACSDWR